PPSCLAAQPGYQALLHLVHPLPSPIFPPAALLRQSGGYQPRGTLAMIPGDHPVIETKQHIGHSQIVIARRRKALQHGSPVVADVARNAALKRRKSGNRGKWRVWQKPS